MASRDNVCDVARARACASLDCELGEFDRRLLERHLQDCAECRSFAESAATFTELLRGEPLEAFECAHLSLNTSRGATLRRVLPAVAAIVLVSTATTSIVASESASQRHRAEVASTSRLGPFAILSHDRSERFVTRIRLPIGQRLAADEF